MSDAGATETQPIIRHLLATLAYRATRVLKDAPEEFAGFSAGEDVMTPRAMLAHVSMILSFADAQLFGSDFERFGPAPTWEAEVERFYATLKTFDDHFASGTPNDEAKLLRMLQGPLLDAFTHVGQLAMLRRLSGAPVCKDHYIKAEIEIGRVGSDQAAPA